MLLEERRGSLPGCCVLRNGTGPERGIIIRVVRNMCLYCWLQRLDVNVNVDCCQNDARSQVDTLPMVRG